VQPTLALAIEDLVPVILSLLALISRRTGAVLAEQSTSSPGAHQDG
jgi:hypothetical protein